MYLLENFCHNGFHNAQWAIEIYFGKLFDDLYAPGQKPFSSVSSKGLAGLDTRLALI
jgi:hypothetical protein